MRRNYEKVLEENGWLYAVSPVWSEDLTRLSCQTMDEHDLRFRLWDRYTEYLMVFVHFYAPGTPPDFTTCPTTQATSAVSGVAEIPAEHFDGRMLGTIVHCSSWPAPVRDIALAWLKPSILPEDRKRARRDFTEVMVLKGRDPERDEVLLKLVADEE